MLDQVAEPKYSIEKDCLSCCLQKYKPFVKEAFKIACLNYTSGMVRLSDNEYERTSLIDAKKMMITDI